MATHKVADLAIKVGEYEVNGEKKGRYKNIGAVMQKDDGGEFITIDSTILTMGLNYIANPKRSERVIVSKFEVRDPGAAPRSGAPARPAAPRRADSGTPADMDDDIPF